MELITKSLVPLVFVVALGWFAGSRNIITAKHGKYFATYVMNFSFPCLLFIKTSTSRVEQLINVKFIGSFAFGLMGMYVVVFLLNKFMYRRTVTESCQSAFVSSFPDMAFMGIPIFMVLFGEKSLISIVVGNIVTSFIMIPLTVFVLELALPKEQKNSMVRMLAGVLSKPLIVAPVLGMLVSALQWKVPALLLEPLALLGNTTSGVSLFALGLIISSERVCFSKFVLLNICHKNILHPLLMMLVVYVVGLEGEWAKEAILLCAMPPAIMTTMFALKYDVLSLESSSSTVIGTLASLVTLAGFMMIVGIGGS